jgi:hypothetical protein
LIGVAETTQKENNMKTLLECLYGLLSHITEEHANEVPLELREILNIVTDQLGEFLDKN